MEMREGSVSLGECVGEAVTAMRFGRAERRRELGKDPVVSRLQGRVCRGGRNATGSGSRSHEGGDGGGDAVGDRQEWREG